DFLGVLVLEEIELFVDLDQFEGGPGTPILFFGQMVVGIALVLGGFSNCECRTIVLQCIFLFEAIFKRGGSKKGDKIGSKAENFFCRFFIFLRLKINGLHYSSNSRSQKEKRHPQLQIIGQKRQLDPKESTVQTNKKKRGANAGNATSKNDDSSDGIVALDDLNWKAVPLPDRLEDAGGFFGLEEIDGVDIVRPEGRGEIQFRVRFVVIYN